MGVGSDKEEEIWIVQEGSSLEIMTVIRADELVKTLCYNTCRLLKISHFNDYPTSVSSVSSLCTTQVGSTHSICLHSCCIQLFTSTNLPWASTILCSLTPPSTSFPLPYILPPPPSSSPTLSLCLPPSLSPLGQLWSSAKTFWDGSHLTLPLNPTEGSMLLQLKLSGSPSWSALVTPVRKDPLSGEGTLHWLCHYVWMYVCMCVCGSHLMQHMLHGSWATNTSAKPSQI